MLGYSSEVLLSEVVNFQNLIIPGDLEQVIHDISCSLSEANTYELQYRMKTKAGDTRWIWDRGQALYNNTGKMVALVGYMSDVTGNYRPILPRLHTAQVDRINVEFAYKNTGVVEDLEVLPEHLGIGMGVVDVRTERPQTIEEIVQLGAAGARVLAPSRIALNPDCGFAPDFGEPPTIDEAYEKLCRLTEAAARLRETFDGRR